MISVVSPRPAAYHRKVCPLSPSGICTRLTYFQFQFIPDLGYPTCREHSTSTELESAARYSEAACALLGPFCRHWSAS